MELWRLIELEGKLQKQPNTIITNFIEIEYKRRKRVFSIPYESNL
jgi:hypothetical protein